MAIVFTDSFDSYAVASDLLKRYGSTPTVPTYSTTAGKFGAGAITVPFGSDSFNASQAAVSKAGLFTGATRICLAYWFKSTAPQQANGNGYVYSTIEILRSDGIWIMGAGVSYISGALLITNGSGNVFATGATNVCDGNWHWIELLFSTNSTNKLYVDGNLDASFAGGSLWNGTNIFPDRFAICAQHRAGNITIDDLIVWTDVGGGTTDAAFPLGQSRIATKRPSGDNSVTFATTTGANHFSQVNETAGSNTNYVRGTSGQKDLYTYSALGFAPLKITSAVLCSYIENPGAGSINFENICLSGATERDGASTLTPAAPFTIQTEFNTDPNTAAAWTGTGLDAAKFGVLAV